MSTVDWNSEQVVNTTTAGDQSAPQVSTLSDGGWVVVWETGSVGSQTASGQVFDADGNKVGSQLTFAGTSSEQVHVADTNDGTFYVAWLNNPQPNSDGVITAEQFNDNTAAAIGSPTAYTTLFAPPPADTIGSLAMTTGPDGADSTGSFPQQAEPSIVFATSSSERWGYQSFNGVAGETSTPSSHTWTNVDGGFGLTYTEIVATDTVTSNIEYQPSLFSTAIDVSTDTGTTNGDNAHLATLPGGESVIVFQGKTASTSGYDVYAAIYGSTIGGGASSGGTALVTDLDVTTTLNHVSDTGDQVTPDVVSLGNDNFFVTWVSGSQVIGQELHYGSVFGSYQLTDVGSPIIINTTALAGTSSPSIAELADGRIVVAYESTDANGFGIREQILDLRNGVVTGVGDNATFYGSFDNSNDNIVATGQGDTLNGDGGDNALFGEGANDTFELWSDGPGTSYTNIITASGGGTNTLDYSQSPGPVDANLAAGTTSNYYGGTDYFTGINGVIGTVFNDTLIAGSAGTTFNGLGGNNTMMGGPGSDTFRLWSDGPGTDNSNYISGDGGDDTLDYSLAPGPVSVNMETGTTLNYYGGTDYFGGIETVIGTAYNDAFTVGPSGGVSLFGEGGNNTFFMSGGSNTINGGTGTNTLNYSFATGLVNVNLATGTTSYFTGGTDTFSAIADVIGSAYNDTLTASATGSVLNGGAGNNTMTGNASADSFELWSDGSGTDYNNYINGGGGLNTLDYTQSPGLVSVNMATGTTSNYYGGTDYFSNIQEVLGSAYNDTLTAGSASAFFNGEGGNNTMMGGAGNDTFQLWSDGPGTSNSNYISGGGGANTLDYSQSPGPVNVNVETGQTSNYYGGTDFFSNIQDVIGSAFNDVLIANGAGTVLTGGGGNDTFEFVEGHANGATATDFTSGTDKLLFSGFGTSGATFVQDNSTTWTVNSANGIDHENIAFANTPTIHPSDYSFV